MNNKKCLSFESTFEILDINPNPVTDFCALNINMPKKGTPVIHIYDDMGRIVMDYETPAMVNGFNSFPLDLSNLSKGIYSLTITFNDDSRYIKLVKL